MQTKQYLHKGSNNHKSNISTRNIHSRARTKHPMETNIRLWQYENNKWTGKSISTGHQRNDTYRKWQIFH